MNPSPARGSGLIAVTCCALLFVLLIVVPAVKAVL